MDLKSVLRESTKFAPSITHDPRPTTHHIVLREGHLGFQFQPGKICYNQIPLFLLYFSATRLKFRHLYCNIIRQSKPLCFCRKWISPSTDTSLQLFVLGWYMFVVKSNPPGGLSPEQDWDIESTHHSSWSNIPIFAPHVKKKHRLHMFIVPTIPQILKHLEPVWKLFWNLRFPVLFPLDFFNFSQAKIMLNISVIKHHSTKTQVNQICLKNLKEIWEMGETVLKWVTVN